MNSTLNKLKQHAKAPKRIKTHERYVKISDIFFDLDNCADVAGIISEIDYIVHVNLNHIHCGKRPILSRKGCRMLLEQFPILVYKEKDKYMCFGGLRSFFLAHIIMTSDEKVRVSLYEEKVSNPEEYAFAGLFLGEIFLLLKSVSDFGRIVNAMPPNLMEKWLEGVTNKTQLAKALGVSRTHFKKTGERA